MRGKTPRIRSLQKCSPPSVGRGVLAQGSHMIEFVLGKLLYLVPTFLGITIIAFGFVRICPATRCS